MPTPGINTRLPDTSNVLPPPWPLSRRCNSALESRDPPKPSWLSLAMLISVAVMGAERPFHTGEPGEFRLERPAGQLGGDHQPRCGGKTVVFKSQSSILERLHIRINQTNAILVSFLTA